MKKYAVALSVLTTAMAFAGSAAAQDWSGFYGGAGVTVSSVKSDAGVALGGEWSTESTALRDGFASSFSTQLDADGVGGGIFGGYNWQAANGLVLGVEISYDVINAEEDYGRSTTGLGVGYDLVNSAQVDGLATVRANVGYAFNQFLVYGTAGFASADATVAAEVLSSGGYSKAGEASEWVNGVAYGLGAAYQPSPNWFVSAQWLRVDLDEQSFVTAYRPGSAYTTPPYTETFTQDVKLDVFRVGVGFRF